jgi:hypothetical protein
MSTLSVPDDGYFVVHTILSVPDDRYFVVHTILSVHDGILNLSMQIFVSSIRVLIISRTFRMTNSKRYFPQSVSSLNHTKHNQMRLPQISVYWLR